MQQRLMIEKKKVKEYPTKQTNYIHKEIQRFETSRGCPHNCPFCYESNELKIFPIPKITKNYVQILDMSFLWQTDIVARIKMLKKPKTYYEAVCGFDYRLMTQEIANALKESRFIKIRIAWDWFMDKQYKIKDCVNMFLKAGYKREDISCFMLVNWKIPYEECLRKLDLLKVWNIKVCDCCYDGGYMTLRHNSSSPIIPIGTYWNENEIRKFRSQCRKHDQLVRFKIDPEIK